MVSGERGRDSLAKILILTLIGIMLALCAIAGGIYLRSPPKALDVLDSLYPGDGGIDRIGSAQFRPGEGGGLDIWAAKPVAGRPRPVLVFFYGGAWVKGRRQDYGFVGRAYAARGFVVVVADYRKVPGVHFPAFVEDGAAAVRWTRDHIADFGGDPSRIVLAGHSAGAYIAVLLALDRGYLTRAGVDPAIVRAAAGLAGPYDFYPFDSPRAVAAMGSAPDPLQTQPISFARSDAPPLWLANGSADTEVKPRNAISLARRLGQLGNRTAMLALYPGLTHNDVIMAISRPFRSKAPVLDDSVAFFDAALSGKPMVAGAGPGAADLAPRHR